MGVLIKNRSIEPTVLPPPFNAVLHGRGSIIYTGTVADVAFDNVRMRGRSTEFVAGYTLGTLTGVKLQGIKAGAIAVGSANTNAIVIGCQGTLTDSGTTTAKAANN